MATCFHHSPELLSCPKNGEVAKAESLGCFQSSSVQKRAAKHREGKAPQCCWEAFLEEKPAVFLGQSHHLGTIEKENRKGDREERTGKGWEE